MAFFQVFISVWGPNPIANYCKCRQFLPFSILNLVPWNEVPPLHLSFYHQMTLCYIPYGKNVSPIVQKGFFTLLVLKKSLEDFHSYCSNHKVDVDYLSLNTFPHNSLTTFTFIFLEARKSKYISLRGLNQMLQCV